MSESNKHSIVRQLINELDDLDKIDESREINEIEDLYDLNALEEVQELHELHERDGRIITSASISGTTYKIWGRGSEGRMCLEGTQLH